MDRIARLRRSELEKKLRDARKVLREIARPDHLARSSRLATWALELIFDEPRADEIAVDSGMSPLRLEISLGAVAPGAEDPREANEAESAPEIADTVPFTPPKTRSLRVVRGGLPQELLKELIG